MSLRRAWAAQEEQEEGEAGSLAEGLGGVGVVGPAGARNNRSASSVSGGCSRHVIWPGRRWGSARHFQLLRVRGAGGGRGAEGGALATWSLRNWCHGAHSAAGGAGGGGHRMQSPGGVRLLYVSGSTHGGGRGAWPDGQDLGGTRREEAVDRAKGNTSRCRGTSPPDVEVVLFPRAGVDAGGSGRPEERSDPGARTQP